MEELFNAYSSLIVFLHVISAVVWVGGMIAIRFAVHYSMQDIQKPEVKLGRILDLLKRFFTMVIPTIVVLLATAIIMAVALGFRGTDLYSMVILKEVIWTMMTFVFVMIYIKRNKAQSYFDAKDFKSAKETLAPLAKWMIPLNIVLGIVAIYLGVTLRGF